MPYGAAGLYAGGTTGLPLFPGDAAAGFRIWYPAEPRSGSSVAPYAAEAQSARRRGWLSRGQAMQDAEPAKHADRFPVLLFFPGWGGTSSQNTVLLQDLASHGCIIAASDVWNPAAYPGDTTAAADLATPLSFDSDAATAAAVVAGARNATRQAQLAVSLLDRLAALDAADPVGRFTGRLDLDHVGVLGFSFGGSVAVETALRDPRVRAVANLDGGVFTDAYLQGFRQPYLLLSMPPMTKADLLSPNPVVRREAELTLIDEERLDGFMTRWGGVRAIIQGMAHVNFQDAPLLNDWRQVGGGIDPARARAVVSDFLLAFFNHHLRGTPSPLPASLLAAPDVSLQTWQSAPTRSDAYDALSWPAYAP